MKLHLYNQFSFNFYAKKKERKNKIIEIESK